MVNFNDALASTKAFLNRKFVKRGLPFLVFIIVAPIGLSRFTNLRYEYSKRKFITYDEAEKQGIQMKKPGEISVEKEFEKIKELDINSWQQVRIPRPWDETIE